MASILDDYLLSADNFARTGRLEELLSGLFGDEVPVRAKGAAAVIGAVRSEYLEAAFDEIGSEFGSVDDYLVGAAGLTPERRAQLKKHLLIDPRKSSFPTKQGGSGCPIVSAPAGAKRR